MEKFSFEKKPALGESYEQFRENILKSAEEVYKNETEKLDKKLENFKNISITLLISSLTTFSYLVAKKMNVDTEGIDNLFNNLNVTVNKEILLKATGGLASATTISTLIETYFSSKLSYLKNKFGMLQKQDDK